MTYRRYPNITPTEEARIRRDAAYGGTKDGGEAQLRQMQREREQGGTDRQVIAHAMRHNPHEVQRAIDEETRNLQMGGWHNAEEMARENVVNRIVGRKKHWRE